MRSSYERGPLLRRPTHPGEVLGEALSAMGMSTDDFAGRINIPSSVLSEIIDGKQPFTTDVADRVGSFMGDGPEIWLRMQAAHDVWEKLQRADEERVEYLEYPIIHMPKQEVAAYRCPCCRSLTLYERAGYEICPVCYWEDDGQDDPYADQTRGGPNGMSLTQGRLNYKRYGAVEKRLKKHARKPTADELP